jgi:UDP:flavonoid glycosyltransferase YjiC (YdhE family)
MSEVRRKRILFVAEGVSLAHVTRPLVLARSLDTNLFEIHFACTSGYESILKNLAARFWPITSIGSDRFLKSLSAGSPLYDRATLHSYVKEDLQLLTNINPDLVIGDFRLSLSVSASQCGVPYAAITNAYWSDFSVMKHYPVPELPITRILGVAFAGAIFHRIQPWVFAYHARPLNEVRRNYGMAPLQNLLKTYTNGDHILYADIPELFPTVTLPENHHYIGPIFWAPEIDLPDWWSELDAQKPIVYVNMGSSGPVHLLPILLRALAGMPLTVAVATAGRWTTSALPANVWSTDFLPGDQVVNRAKLVICNGGSPTVYQALRGGIPVLGIASNMDQHLMMEAVAREGAGILERSDSARVDSLQVAVATLLEDESYRRGARKLQAEMAEHCAEKRFAAFIDGAELNSSHEAHSVFPSEPERNRSIGR